MFALTAPVIAAAGSHTGRALVASFALRGLIVVVIIGVGWYIARRRGSGPGRD